MPTLISRASARFIPVPTLSGEAETYSVDELSAMAQLDFELLKGEGHTP